MGALWRRLEAAGDTPFFLSWTWIGTWLRSLPSHIRPQLLTATRDGEAVGAAILVPRRERRFGLINVRQLHFNATGDPALDCIWIEHNGFVARADSKAELWPAFLRWFARQDEADELLIPRAAGESIPNLPHGVKLLHESYRFPAFRAPLPVGGMEALLVQFSANARQQLRRSLRACRALGEVRCEAAASVETALAWFDALKVHHVASWEARGVPNAFRRPFWETFHRNLLTDGGQDRSVRLRRISAGGTPIGFLYDFRRGDTVYAYQSGFDYAREDLKPGYVSHLLAMTESAAEGAQCYDFMAGDNRLKRSLGCERYAVISYRFAKPTVGLSLEAPFRSWKNRLARR